jgi:hypothetical protein
MTPIQSGAFPPGVEAGRIGLKRAVDMQTRAAQEVAEAGVQGMQTDTVTLSSAALNGRGDLPSLDRGLIDSQVAQYLALANVKVVQTSAETSQSIMDVLGD